MGVFSDKATSQPLSGGGVFANKKKKKEEAPVKVDLSLLRPSHGPLPDPATILGPQKGNGISKNILNFGAGLSEGIAGDTARKNREMLDASLSRLGIEPPPTTVEPQDGLVKTIGNFAGMALPAGAAYKAIGTPLAKGATTLTSKFAPKLTKLADISTKGAGAGAAIGAIEGVRQGDTPGEIARQTAIGAGFGAVGDVALHGLGRAVRPWLIKNFGRTVEPYLSPDMLESRVVGMLPEGTPGKPIRTQAPTMPSGPVIEMQGNTPMFIDVDGSVIDATRYGQKGLPAPNRPLLMSPQQAEVLRTANAPKFVPKNRFSVPERLPEGQQNTYKLLSDYVTKTEKQLARELKNIDAENVGNTLVDVKRRGGIKIFPDNAYYTEYAESIPAEIRRQITNPNASPIDEVANDLGMSVDDLLQKLAGQKTRASKDYLKQAQDLLYKEDLEYAEARSLLQELESQKVKSVKAPKLPQPKKHEFKFKNDGPIILEQKSSIEPPRQEPPLQFKKTIAVPKPEPKLPPKLKMEPPVASKQQPKLESPAISKQQPKVEVPKVVKEQVAATTKNIDATKLKDVGGFRAYTTDVYRNFRDVFGSQYEQVKKSILDPFDESKKANVDMQKEWADKLKTEVVDRLGIKKGSKESAFVQQYGEKKVSIDELKKQRPNDWQKIVEADKWFRKAYDQLLDEVNEVRKQLYPTNPEKIVPKRKDYYRHFRELSDTIEGVKNLFESPAAIDPNLAGVSDFTLPKSRFAGFMQRRGLGPYKNDAVGGFLEYLPAASYAKNIDPHIGKFESLANELAQNTTDTKNINNFIEYLRDFSRDLAGKTNPADRFFQKIIPGGRTTFRLINWLNSRVKSNAVLGNVGSALSQIANVPQGIAFAKQHSAIGFGRTVKGILTKSKGPMSESGFLAERYSRDIYSQFDTKIIDKPKQMAAWMLEATDRIGTEFIWNSAYAKGVAQKVKNPVKYADDMTRNLVAGRGIGEVPLLQKSKLFQIVAPFQLEVANLWKVQGDFVKSKDFGALVGLYLANFMFNKAMEETRGSGVVFDPIDAMIDAFGEESTTTGQKAGRLIGEVLSNAPLGQSIAAQLPEETRRDLFGRQDPTRFGTGLLVTKGIQNPASRLLSPFGGAQAEKTLKGATALGMNPLSQVPTPGVYNRDKTQLKYPVKPDTENTIKGLLFGTTGLKETDDYYKNNRRPLGEKQTEEFIKKAARGQDREHMYEQLLLTRELNNVEAKIKELRKTPGNQQQIETLKLQRARLKQQTRGGR